MVNLPRGLFFVMIGWQFQADHLALEDCLVGDYLHSLRRDALERGQISPLIGIGDEGIIDKDRVSQSHGALLVAGERSSFRNRHGEGCPDWEKVDRRIPCRSMMPSGHGFGEKETTHDSCDRGHDWLGKEEPGMSAIAGT